MRSIIVAMARRSISAFSTNLTFTVNVSECLTKKDEEKGQSNFGASGKQFSV